MIAFHNELRSVHFSPPVQNNTNMSIAAKEWALKLAAEKDLRHASIEEGLGKGEGENLAMGCIEGEGDGITAREAIAKWYDVHCSII